MDVVIKVERNAIQREEILVSYMQTLGIQWPKLKQRLICTLHGVLQIDCEATGLGVIVELNDGQFGGGRLCEERDSY